MPERLVETLCNANIRVIGPELIFGTLFDRIGLKQIPDELFRHLVLGLFLKLRQLRVLG